MSDPTTNQVQEGDEEGYYLIVIIAGALVVVTGLAAMATGLLYRFLPRKRDAAPTTNEIASQ